MKLASARDLEKQRDVLRDPTANGADPVYWVFNEVSQNDWANVTITPSGLYNSEYPKTYGHYHTETAPDETYYVIEGEGVLQLQRKHIENGEIVAEKVDEVFLVKAKAGDTIVIKNDMGHSWSNIGKTPLITYDNWRSGHTPSEYTPMQKMHGLAYYLVEENGEVRAHANPNYIDLPEPKWVSASEFSTQQDSQH